MEEEKELGDAYNLAADNFLFTRTVGKEIIGFENREIEQPMMCKLVPKDLKNKKLLDIGCGPGIHLKEYIKRGAEGFGVDISKEMVKLAKKYCPEGNFKVGSVYSLGFEDNSFDVLTASYMLDHVKDLEKVVSEVKRVLKGDGLFIFSIPHPIIYMFRDSEEGKFVPSHSYFDKRTWYVDIVGDGKKFPDFPRTLQEYFGPFIKEKFTLVDFIENEPKDIWKEKFKELNTYFLKIPLIAFFKWEKS